MVLDLDFILELHLLIFFKLKISKKDFILITLSRKSIDALSLQNMNFYFSILFKIILISTIARGLIKNIYICV